MARVMAVAPDVAPARDCGVIGQTRPPARCSWGSQKALPFGLLAKGRLTEDERSGAPWTRQNGGSSPERLATRTGEDGPRVCADEGAGGGLSPT